MALGVLPTMRTISPQAFVQRGRCGAVPRQLSRPARVLQARIKANEPQSPPASLVGRRVVSSSGSLVPPNFRRYSGDVSRAGANTHKVAAQKARPHSFNFGTGKVIRAQRLEVVVLTMPIPTGIATTSGRRVNSFSTRELGAGKSTTPERLVSTAGARKRPLPSL